MSSKTNLSPSVTHKILRVDFQIPWEQFSHFTFSNSVITHPGLHISLFFLINGLQRVPVACMTWEVPFLFLFCRQAATGGSRSLERTLLPKKSPRRVLYMCIPRPVSHGEKSRGKRGVGVLGMKRLVGERSRGVSTAGTSWMVRCFAKPRCFSYSFLPAFLSRCKENVTELFSCLRREDDMWEL